MFCSELEEKISFYKTWASWSCRTESCWFLFPKAAAGEGLTAPHPAARLAWRKRCLHNSHQLHTKSHGRRSLVGYSPWGPKELDTTERLHSPYILTEAQKTIIYGIQSVLYTTVDNITHGCVLEKETATHSSTLAWRIPGTEEPGRLQLVGSQRVRHDWAINFHFHCCI